MSYLRSWKLAILFCDSCPKLLLETWIVICILCLLWSHRKNPGMRTWTSTPSSFPFLSKGTTVHFCFSFPLKVQNVLAPKEIKACKQSSDVSRTSHQLHPADPLHRHLKEYERTRLQEAKATRNVNY